MSYNLRPYQTECIEAIDLAFLNNNSTLVEMATGLGKTVTFAHIADRWPGRVLVIAHREELVQQAAEKIHSITGHPVGIEMGRERANDELHSPKVIVGSVQTLCKPNRRERYHPDHFSLMVIDEGHHAPAASYREVMDYFRCAKKLLVTATPKRADEVAMATVCDSVAFQYGIEPAIDDGWLVPVHQTVVKVDGLDFSKARTVAADFNEGDLERILTEEEPLHKMCGSAYEVIGNRQALWFCVTVKHSQLVAGVLSRYATGGVQFLSGATAKEDRRAAVESYKKGNIQHLVNCALFLEGFDAPATSAIVMARPTKSLSLYMQVLGRGTRPLPGIVDGIETAEQRRNAIAMSAKPQMVVIDYAGNAGRHKIVQAADVLGGKHDLPTREYAKKTMQEEGRVVDLEDALARAKEELELIEEESKLRKHIKASKVEYQTYDVNPFVHRHTGKRQQFNQPAELCTPKQAGFICYLSRQVGSSWDYESASRLSAKQARGVISKLMAQGAHA